MKLNLMLIILSLAIVGCASTIPKHERPIPDDQIYLPELTIKHDGDVAVKFVRDNDIKIGSCPNYVFIDNRKAFDLRPNESITIFLEPGAQLFRVSTGGGWCAAAQDISRETVIKTDTPQMYRVVTTTSGEMDLIRVR